MKGPVVIVGGGTAGCTVAAYLATHTTCDIVMCEPGRVSDRDDDSHFFEGVRGEYVAEHLISLTSAGHTAQYTQARVMGGGSAVNGMVLSGDEPEHLRGLTRMASSSDMGEVGQALVASGGRPTRLWWNNGRWNPGRAFVHVLEKDRVRWVQESVTRIVHSRGAVVGVVCGDQEIRTDCVVMAAGAIMTPALLLASGCGSLSPRIGEGLQDHPNATFSLALKSPSHSSFDVAAMKHIPLAKGGQGLVLAYERAGVAGQSVGLLTASLLTPVAQGRVGVRDGVPSVSLNLLGHEDDMGAMSDLVRTVALLTQNEHFLALASEAMADSVGTSARTVAMMSDDEVRSWLPTALTPVSHVSGSMRYAVDSCGRVLGMSGLRVADASVLPGVPAETPAAPVAIESLRLARVLGEDLT